VPATDLFERVVVGRLYGLSSYPGLGILEVAEMVSVKWNRWLQHLVQSNLLKEKKEVARKVKSWSWRRGV